jgi:ribosomal protein L29
MVIIRKKEIQNLNKEELMGRIKELELELLKANAHKQSSGPKRNKEIRRTISRLNTQLNQTK